MVQLLGCLSFPGFNVNHFLLHAHIFPSSAKRNTNNEWGLHSPCYYKSDYFCGCLRCFRYASHLMSSSLYPIEFASGNNLSRQTQVLSTLDHCKRSLDITRNRPHIDFHTNDTNRHLDRLSDSCRRWSWMRYTNGKHTAARSDKTPY